MNANSDDNIATFKKMYIAPVILTDCININ